MMLLGLLSASGCMTIPFWGDRGDDSVKVVASPAAVEAPVEEWVEVFAEELPEEDPVLLVEPVEELKPVRFDEPIQIQAPDTSQTP